jgi:hypothetical protein
MRNTLQEQYNLIKEGKGNKQQFFKSARHLFPDLVTPVNTFDDTVRILKNRSIITEGIGGVVTTGKKQDWHAIFNENMANLKEELPAEKELKALGVKYELGGSKSSPIKKIFKPVNKDDAFYKKFEDIVSRNNLEGAVVSSLNEAKAEEKETTKEVTDMATRGYDYKDAKNYDNVFGEEFLKGFYTEMQDPKNEGKTVEELRAIVAKNLAKDLSHYVKDGQFGIKGVGYTTEAPGLGTPKEAKGKHKSSGYGDLKESVLRSQIYLLVKEVLDEANEAKFKVGDIVVYNGEEYEITRFFKDQIYIKSLTYGGRPDTWVKAKDLKKINKPLTPEDEPAFMQAVDFAEDLYDKLGNVEDVLVNLPSRFVRYEDDLKQHLTQKFEG